jgi:hypothetical protein
MANLKNVNLAINEVSMGLPYLKSGGIVAFPLWENITKFERKLVEQGIRAIKEISKVDVSKNSVVAYKK